MSIEVITSRLKQKLPLIAGMNAKLGFDFGDAGQIFVDATQSPPVLRTETMETDVILAASPEVFTAILDGTQDPTMAYMMGKLKVRGSMGLAMKLNAILED